VQDARGAPLVDIYGRLRDPAPLLFDLQNDPQETNDVGGQFPEVRASLARQLADWRASEIAARNGRDPVLDNGLSLAYDAFMARLLSRRLF
jgi:hypothetical protein